MPANFSRLLPWLILSIILAALALLVQSTHPGNVLAVSIYKAHLCSLGGWIGYWLDRALFPYDRPHEYLLPEAAPEPDHRAAAQIHADDLLSTSTSTSATAYAEGLSLAAPSQYGLAMIRRAIIVAAALLCMGLGA